LYELEGRVAKHPSGSAVNIFAFIILSSEGAMFNNNKFLKIVNSENAVLSTVNQQ